MAEAAKMMLDGIHAKAEAVKQKQRGEDIINKFSIYQNPEGSRYVEVHEKQVINDVWTGKNYYDQKSTSIERAIIKINGVEEYRVDRGWLGISYPEIIKE